MDFFFLTQRMTPICGQASFLDPGVETGYSARAGTGNASYH